MKTSNIVIDVNTRAGVIARTSMRKLKDGYSIKKHTINGDPARTTTENLFIGAAAVLEQLNSVEFHGRVSLILPESVSLRIMGAIKTIKDGEDAREKLYLPWMQKSDKRKETRYLSAINDFVEQAETFLSEENSLNIVNARSLYRYEINGAIEELSEGEKIKFVNSHTEDDKIECAENNYLNGLYTVTKQTIRDREGNSRERAFVQRIYKVTVNEEKKQLTATEIINAIDDGVDIEGNSDTTSAAINAIELRRKNAELLPRTNVVKDMVVEDANEGALF